MYTQPNELFEINYFEFRNITLINLIKITNDFKKEFINTNFYSLLMNLLASIIYD